MARISAPKAGGLNVTAFLDMIAHSEIGEKMLAASDEGYNVLVGSRPEQIFTFSSYADHPHALLDVDGNPGGLESSAAGRYQIMYRYWKPYKAILQLPDFSPISQDKYAIRQLSESHALPFVLSGNFDDAVTKCAHIWASLPGSQYGQHVNEIDDLRMAYLNAGGSLT